MRNEWEDIPFKTRFVWLLSITLITSAFAIVVRPENVIANFWHSEFGLRYDAVALFFYFAPGMLLPLVYKRFGTLLSIAIMSMPALLMFGVLIWYLMTTPNSAPIHGVIGSGLVLMILLNFDMVTKLDALEAANQKLYEQIGKTGETTPTRIDEG